MCLFWSFIHIFLMYLYFVGLSSNCQHVFVLTLERFTPLSFFLFYFAAYWTSVHHSANANANVLHLLDVSVCICCSSAPKWPKRKDWTPGAWSFSSVLFTGFILLSHYAAGTLSWFPAHPLGFTLDTKLTYSAVWLKSIAAKGRLSAS